MKFFIVALCVFAAAAASSVEQAAQVLSSEYNQFPEGYNYAYETENGISGKETGVVKTYGKDEVAVEVNGFSEYKSPEGVIVSLKYSADNNGYHAEGSHLPTPPAPQPIPDYILRAIEYIKAHPYVEKKL